MIAMFALSLVTPANAGEIALTRGGSPGLFVFVDGEAKGKLTKKEPMTLPATDGKHELWFSWDDDAYNTACHGTIELKGSFAWEVAPLKQGCDVLTNEIPDKTMARGAFLHITSASGDTTLYTGEIDGRYANGTGLYNLAPGGHTVLIKAGAGQDQHQVCVGTVTLAANESRTFLLTPSQCTGFDNELHIVH